MQKILTIACVLLTFKGFSQSSDTCWSLRKCIDTALAKSISIKQNVVQVANAGIELNQAQMNRYPSLSFSTPLGVQLGRSINPITNTFTPNSLLYQTFSASGSLPLINWGKLVDQAKSQRAAFEATVLMEAKEKGDIELSVMQNYLQTFLSKEQLNNAIIQLRQTKKQLEVANIRFKSDKLTEIDLAQLTSQLATDSISVLTQRNAFDKNLIALKALINIPFSVPFDVNTSDLSPKAPNAVPSNPEQVYFEALQNLPLAKGDQLKIQSAELNLAAAKKSLYPSLSLDYNLSSSFSNYFFHQSFAQLWSGYGFQAKGNFTQQISLTFTVPIFSNNRLQNAVKQSRLDIESSNYQLDQDCLQLKQTIYSLYSDVVFADKVYEEGKSALSGSETAYNLTLKGFEFGAKDVFTLLTSQNNLAKVQQAQTANRCDLIFKSLMLQFYSDGKL